MFNKLVAVEPLNLLPETEASFRKYAETFELYPTLPKNEEEIVERIKDADGVLLNLYTPLSKEVLEQCDKLKYIGLCCTLYNDESCTVHLPTAKRMGITVTGVSDYGDKGVPEFVVSALIDFLHGFSGRQWQDQPLELYGQKIGILGMGTTGGLIARALKFFEAKVCYYSRTQKAFAKEHNIPYVSLEEMLESCSIICSSLNKNVMLLDDEKLRRWSGNKILVNTGLSPSYSLDTIVEWLDGGNYLFCDSEMALGDKALLSHPNVISPLKFAGSSKQCIQRLGDGVISNIEAYLE